MNKNTTKHMEWFISHGVKRVDVGILNRRTGKMQLKLNQEIHSIDKLISFCTYKNDIDCIYVRPVRSKSHKVIFVDDVEEKIMKKIIKEFDGISIRTSKEGGFQLWIATDVTLNEEQRKSVQTFIQPYFKSDPKSLSGEHFGRLAGFKNHKRNGQWVNVYCANKNGRKINTKTA